MPFLLDGANLTSSALGNAYLSQGLCCDYRVSFSCLELHLSHGRCLDVWIARDQRVCLVIRVPPSNVYTGPPGTFVPLLALQFAAGFVSLWLQDLGLAPDSAPHFTGTEIPEGHLYPIVSFSREL